MTTDRISLKYVIEFESPFHCGTGLRRGLVHRAIARDASGFLFVPGSPIKGVARDKCEQIAGLFELPTREPHEEAAQVSELYNGPGIVDDIFGSRSQPGTLFFDDAQMLQEDRSLFERPSGPNGGSVTLQARYREFQIAPRTRVQISRVTGVQKSAHLFELEFGLPKLRFEGSIRGALTGIPIGTEGPTYPVVMLVAGLLAIEALGGGRSVGGGQCRVQFEVVELNGANWPVTRILDSLGELEYYEVAKQ